MKTNTFQSEIGNTSTIEMKNKVLSDDETKCIDVSNINDLIIAFNYLEMRGIEKDGCLPVLKTKPYLEIQYRITERKKREIQRSNIQLFGEDSRDLEASLDKFSIKTAKRKNAHKLAKMIVSGGLNIGLYIHCPKFQIGKTYLANAIVNGLADKGFSGSFLFAPSFSRQAKDFPRLEERLKTLNQCDVLVIDDIGAEYRSDWFRIEILMPILQHRLSRRKLTIFTSNYSIDQLEALYRQQSQPVDVKRLMTRIRDLTEEIEIDDIGE